MPFSIRPDRRLIRAQASSVRYLLATYVAPETPPRDNRLPVNVALVLDRSGSMEGERKFEIARQAVEQALHMLRSEDRFALVVYDERVDVLAPTTFATSDAKRHAIEALQEVGPRGSTDLCSGWMRGCEQIAEAVDDESLNRVMLLTDGLANHGIVDPETLGRHARELRSRGIATSTFGVGADFDERLLRDIAHEGGGHFYFIQTPAQITDLLTSELGEALEVVARNVALRIALPHGASAEPLNRFRFSQTRRDDLVNENETRIELGDLVSGQEVRAVVRVQFPRGELGDFARVRASLEGVGVDEGREEIALMYASHLDNDRQQRDVEVDREVASLYAARARAEATEANRHGDFESARRLIERTAVRVQQYTGDDSVLRGIVGALRADVAQFAEQAMSPMALKQAFFVAESAALSRSPEGKARRR
jgi:Ca-activated chloride channel family protein